MARLKVLLPVLAVVGGLGVSASAETPPSGPVSNVAITAAELRSGATAPGLNRNDRFAPPANAQAATQDFVGTLKFDGVTMHVVSNGTGGNTLTNFVSSKDPMFFPNASASFFSVSGRLVPTTQDVIRNGILPNTRSYWDMIVQPGRVWSQPGDDGWNRASFPFSLVNEFDGETHIAIAIFLYKGSQVTPVRFQIVQMGTPAYVPEFFTAWGTTGAHYQPGGISNLAQRAQRFRDDQAARLPVRPMSDLTAASGASTATINAFTSYPDVEQSGVVFGGRLYRTNCPTAAGPHPYCDDLRYGVWSVTKSAMLNAALMRLAQKYGTGFLDEPIAHYLPAAAAEGWTDVTFRHLANMASGHGAAGNPLCYLCDIDAWAIAPSNQDKITKALNINDYPRFAPPGTVLNYRDQDAHLLGVAEDALLKAHEGPNATVWNLLRQEVYQPIGVFNAPTNSTVEPDGSAGQPLLAYGYYPTFDDLAKVAMLYENHGEWNHHQILNRSLVDELQSGVGTAPARSICCSADGSGTPYFMNWWLPRLDSTEGCTRYVPTAEGWGGNTTSLFPGQVALLRTRNHPYDPNLDAVRGDRAAGWPSIAALGDQLARTCP